MPSAETQGQGPVALNRHPQGGAVSSLRRLYQLLVVDQRRLHARLSHSGRPATKGYFPDVGIFDCYPRPLAPISKGALTPPSANSSASSKPMLRPASHFVRATSGSTPFLASCMWGEA